MSRRHNLDTPQHQQTRSALRIIGPLILIVGLVLTIIGLSGFFSAFGSGPSFGETPPGMRRFFLAFLGLPMMAVGGAITKFAFMGSVARYVASEAAPVVKDTTNYMIDGTKDAVGDLAQSVGAGIAAGMAGDKPSVDTVDCPGCGEACDSGARFCSQCGAPIPGPVRCEQCDAMCEPDAKFCDQCGVSMGV